MSTVLEAREGKAGLLTLNRPQALNAIDAAMFSAIEATLLKWRDDPDVELVVVRGAGKAFCAGGDIRAVSAAAAAGDREHNERLYRTEYAINALIAEYPKPYVALIDGYCMGGGLGLAMHGSHRVVSERAVLAMPETAIGFFPDVGASYVLPRLAGGVGLYLGLTGARLNAADALACGLATHAVASSRLDELTARLRQGSAAIAPALDECGGASLPAPELAPHARAIERCFTVNSLDAVLAALRREDSDWARGTLATLQQRSPTALAVTFALFARGAHLSLRACLEMELRLGRTMSVAHDFREGVRAAVVDKDRTPVWSPPALADVDRAAVQALVDAAAS